VDVHAISFMGTSKNLLRVALSVCDARRTSVRLCFSTEIAAPRDGFSRCPYVGYVDRALQIVAGDSGHAEDGSIWWAESGSYSELIG
jgi:hypothetical protein